MKAFLAALAIATTLSACGDERTTADKPAPVAISEEALGHYCQMNLISHPGPKAQIHLAGNEAPIWFSQVRDGIAYIKAGERTSDILVVYVNDMGAAKTWAAPGADTWIVADAATFVVGSNAVGGMGAPEIVPFGRLEDATVFANAHGGYVSRLAEIPVNAVLGPVDAAAGLMDDPS